MKIHTDILRRYVALPAAVSQVRELLDDLGLEVKRSDPSGNMTLELLANRGDHHAYEGLAREIRGRSGAALCLPEVTPLTVGESPWPLRLETDTCLVYTATLLEKISEGSFPEEVLAPLRAAGMNSVLPPVDATNLSNLELGQPTHAFDADTLQGPVTIRLSRAGESAWPLFTAGPVPIPEGTLVIADDAKILAIAGVIGCEESKTSASTRRLLLESATFDPVKVRIASRALGLHTDASARFERGSDPSRPLVGAGRVVALLEQHAGWRRVGPTGQVGAWRDPQRTLRLNLAAAEAFLALPVPDAAQRLSWLGYTCTPAEPGVLQVQVPPHRLWDVEHVADLYEDLARSIGYNNTPIALPPVDMGSQPSWAERRKARVEEVLLGQGFYEVLTDGFYGRATVDTLNLPADHPLRQHVETQNALDRGYSLLKNNALAQAVEAVAINLRARNEEIRCYEWTRTFHPSPQTPGPDGFMGPPCTERPLLWAIAWGKDRPRAWDDRSRPADLYFFKGLVQELAVELGIPLRLGPPDPSYPLSACLHSQRQATLRLGEAVVGVVGEVHPAVLRNLKIKRGRPVYLELETQATLGARQRPAWEEPSTLHPIERSLALTLPPRLPTGEVIMALSAAAPPWLQDLRVVDHFAHEDAGVPVVTYTFALRFANAEGGERSAEDVNQAVNGMLSAALARHGDSGLKLRA